MARVRTEEKRDEIIRIAAELFEEYGYRALLDGGALGADRRLEGDPLRLLPVEGGFAPGRSRFRGREAKPTTSSGIFRRRTDLRESLILLGTAYLNKRMSPLPLANIRMVANQPAGSTMGKDFYFNVIRPNFHRLADKFEELMDQGKLKRADP